MQAESPGVNFHGSEEERTFEIDLTTLVYGGDAMGRLPDGRAVFIPYASPGERVVARLNEEKRGFARADLLQVLKPSPNRITPRCLHFATCGGCHYQHMPYPAQFVAKQEILRDQLERIGGMKSPPVRPAVPSPEEWNYRNNIQFHLTSEGILGFMASRSNEVIPIKECHLPDHLLLQVWEQLEISDTPGLERVGLRLGKDGDIMLILEGSSPQAPEVMVEDLPISVVYLNPSGSIVLAGSEYLVMDVLGREFQVSAGSFFQINIPQAEAMVRFVLKQLPTSVIGIFIDAYCGVGLFSAFLAPKASRVIAIESSSSAVQDYMVNLEEFEHVELYEGQVEVVLPVLDLHPDVILVDPPRAGLDRAVLDALLRMAPAVLIYVSCDAATLARDARRLTAGGYQLAEVVPFDLFPQTYAIESVSVWKRVG